MKPIILFFQSTWSKSWRDKLSGVYKYADAVGWHVQVVESDISPRDVRALVQRWNPAGCLVDRGLCNGRPPMRVFGQTPVVFIDQNPQTAAGCVALTHDSRASTLLAVSELHRRGLTRLAYVSWSTSLFWDRQRRATLRDYARTHGLEHHEASLDDNLEQWLTCLPKPCGIVCASDITAKRILSSALLCHIAVPDEIAVVGIDNDEEICEHTTPTLTSVAPDFTAAGYRLGALLHRRIANIQTACALETYGPREIVVRESSQWMPRLDARVKDALAFIRLHADDPSLDVQAVLAQMGCARTYADTLFHRATGHSIIAEIHRIRLEHAFRLMRNPRQSISAIPSLCGYRSDSFFKCLFKRETGLSMREWRKQQT